MKLLALKIVLPVVFLLLTFGARASEIRFDFEWVGAAGYRVDGFFAYDDSSSVGQILADEELTKFSFTLFEPDGHALKTYTLDNLSANDFDFFFDLSSQELLNVWNPNHPEHYLDYFHVGERSVETDTYFFTERIGCDEQSIPGNNQDGFEVFRGGTGSCDAELLDFDSGGHESLIITKLADTNEPFAAIAMIPDVNNNNFPEIAILKNRSPVVYINDSGTDERLGRIEFFRKGGYSALGMTVIDDINGNGIAEIVVLGIRDDRSQMISQVRDSSTGDYLNNVIYPSD